ncbi:uncharacterized protein [Amphiura filiformis]|uniref:uncharacterized protein n=1 Tax=Amphiura filiformis TaxID=82378 RepID=UPI003B2124A4
MDVRSTRSQKAFNVFDELQKNRQLCDVTLKADGQEFPAHRNILAACSPYFRALFTNGMNETKEATVQIPEVDPQLFSLLLDYAYTREVKVTSENVEKILPLADQFNVPGLVDMCCQFLTEHLTSDNSIGIWRFARSYFCFRLQESAFRFVLIHFESITSGNDLDEFLSLTIDELIEIISEDGLNVKMEEFVFEAVTRWIKHKEKDRKQYIYRILLSIRLGMTNTDFFMNNIKSHEYVKDNEECRSLIVQTLNYTYNFEAVDSLCGPSQVVSRPREPYRLLFAVGGWSGGSPTSALECYDTRADRWTIIDTENNRPRAYMGVAVLNGRLYCIGGFDSNQYFNSVRSFDPQTKRWDDVAPMHSRRCYVSVAVLGGCIYAMGGFDGHTRLRTVERYDPHENQWTMIRQMNHHRSDASACNNNGRLVIVGGFNGNECLSTCEMYDPEMGEWRDLPRMNSRRSGVGCVGFRDSVYAVGGFNGLTRLNTMERWASSSLSWTPCPSMYIHRSNFGVAVLDDMIFVIGGFNGITTIYNVECYDPDNEEWYDAADMNVYRSALSIGVMAGVPNISDFCWPRDRGLPPPMTQQQSANPNNLEQAMQALRQTDEARERHARRAAEVAAQQRRDAQVQQAAPEEQQRQEQAAEEAAADIEEEESDAELDPELDEAGEDEGVEDDEDDDEEEVQIPERPPNPRRPPMRSNSLRPGTRDQES